MRRAIATLSQLLACQYITSMAHGSSSKGKKKFRAASRRQAEFRELLSIVLDWPAVEDWRARPCASTA